MRFVSKIDYLCEQPGKIERCLIPEIKSHKADRAKVSIEKKSKKIIITIKSDDIAALRAAFNSMTKLLSVYEEMEKI